MTNYEKQEMRSKTNLIHLKEMNGKEQLDFVWNMLESLTSELKRMQKEAEKEQGKFGEYTNSFEEGYKVAQELSKVESALYAAQDKVNEAYVCLGNEEYEVY